MPSIVRPAVPQYVPAAPTKEPLEYADLAVLDFSKIGTPAGRTELAAQLCEAMTTHGFFYVVNHGLMQTENDRVFDIADVPFSSVPDEEKRVYLADIKGAGSYQGYKLREFWHIDGGVRDQIEHYNVNHDVTRKQHPQALRPLAPEIEAFARFNHFQVLNPLLRLFALGLELPEETFVDLHDYDKVGESYVRFVKYYPRSEPDEAQAKQVWLKGHTDIGTVTVLWSQPVAALQILSPDGKWRFVKHIPNALVINSGDAMDFLSGGFYKPTIHRVVQPPQDQHGQPRLGVIYFSMPNDAVRLLPRVESPVLQRVGLRLRCEDDQTPTMEEWRRGRTSTYGLSKLQMKENGVEEELVKGLVVKHFN